MKDKRPDKLIPEPNELEVMHQEEFNQVLDKHLMFIRGQRGGKRAILKYRNLSYLNFHNSNLSQADFTGSLLIGADLSFGIYQSTCFFACDLRNADMSRADFSRADLRGCYLAGADLSGTDLSGADVREGKIMTNSRERGLEDRQRMGIETSKTIFTGARMQNCDLSGMLAKAADFSDADLHGAIFRDAKMSGANFEGANLSGGDFTDADISHCNMRDAIRPGIITVGADVFGINDENSLTEDSVGAKLEYSPAELKGLLEMHSLWVSSAGKNGRRLDLSNYDLRDVLNLNHYPLTAIKATGSSFVGQDMRRANMQSAIFDKSDFRDCNFEYSDVRGGSFKDALMTRVNFRGAKLGSLYFKRDGQRRMKRSNFSGAVMRYGDFRHADLQDVIMMGADLTNAVLIEADLRGADLTGATIKGAKLDGALMDEAKIDFSAL